MTHQVAMFLALFAGLMVLLACWRVVLMVLLALSASVFVVGLVEVSSWLGALR